MSANLFLKYIRDSLDCAETLEKEDLPTAILFYEAMVKELLEYIAKLKSQT